MPEQDPDYTRARKKAMDLLARREHGRVELERKLVAAGIEAETASGVIAQLADAGLQDDRRFVESFVRSRINQGKGPVRIRAELGERGMSTNVVEEVLAEVAEDWYALASEIRVKKFGAQPPADFTDKARQMRFLHYRGFESDQIQAAIAASGE